MGRDQGHSAGTFPNKSACSDPLVITASERSGGKKVIGPKAAAGGKAVVEVRSTDRLRREE